MGPFRSVRAPVCSGTERREATEVGICLLWAPFLWTVFGVDRCWEDRREGSQLLGKAPHDLAFLHLCLMAPQATDLGASSWSLSSHLAWREKGP